MMPGWSDCLTRMTTPSTDRSTSKRPTRVMKASLPFLTTPSTAIWELLFSAAENLVLAVPKATRNDVRISYRLFGALSEAVKGHSFLGRFDCQHRHARMLCNLAGVGSYCQLCTNVVVSHAHEKQTMQLRIVVISGHCSGGSGDGQHSNPKAPSMSYHGQRSCSKHGKADGTS